MKKTLAIFTTKDPVADRLIDSWFEKVKHLDVIHFSNNTQFLKLRLEHVKGNIQIESFNLDGEICKMLEDGQMDYVPNGFFDTSFNMALELAKLVNGKRLLVQSDKKKPERYLSGFFLYEFFTF